MEEHFYLLLPALLGFGRKRAVPLLTTLSVLFLIWPPIARHLGLAPSELSYSRTDMSLRNLLFPALLAVLLMRPSFRTWMTRISSYNLLIVLTVAAILVSQIVLGGHLGGEIICIGFPLMVISTMLHPSGWFGRFLESWPLVFLGRISYSLYLWQQLFFIERQDYSALRFVQNLPLNLIAVLICAVASYYFIEKPLMRLGHRLAPPGTPGRPDLIGSSAA